MKETEFFLLKGGLRKFTKDRNLYNALMKACHERLQFVQGIGITDQNARFIVENLVSSLLDGINANIVAEGFLSESEEASVAYMQKHVGKAITKEDLDYIERLRKLKDGIKTYGNSANSYEAQQVLVFARKMVPILKNINQQQYYRL